MPAERVVKPTSCPSLLIESDLAVSSLSLWSLPDSDLRLEAKR
jgi:hypothetical protein